MSESPSAEFQLSVTLALRDQLLSALDELEPAPLDETGLLSISKRGGVYQLFLDKDLVYVGKSAKDLRGRLDQHRRKLSGRTGALLERVSFRCVYVAEDLDAMAPEKMLIARLRSEGKAHWNTNGFGNKDPGRQRDSSLVAEGHFDFAYPIDLSLHITLHPASPHSTLSFVMESLKKQLPYTFRFETGSALARLTAITVDDFFTSTTTQTAAEWLEFLASRLPPEWTIVALPGYLIAYPDMAAMSLSHSRTALWQATGGSFDYIPHQAEAGDIVVEIDE